MAEDILKYQAGREAAIRGRKLRVLDLFSGIGGFSLGLERATMEGGEYVGFETTAFCEIEEFPRKVLAKHWPDVPCYRDVRELTAERLAADGIAVDVICGGFPCQDISFAGKGAGLAGERSGLFYEVARLISELEPRYVILENVAALLSRGLADVLGTLASLGYDAEWHCIPASYVGAPHRRDRIWIMAYARHSAGTRPKAVQCGNARLVSIQQENGSEGANPALECGEALANANGEGLEGRSLTGDTCEVGQRFQQQLERCPASDWPEWEPEPNVGRVANGVPDRAHRLKCLGNAVVPQIPELIGRAILATQNTTIRGDKRDGRKHSDWLEGYDAVAGDR